MKKMHNAEAGPGNDTAVSKSNTLYNPCSPEAIHDKPHEDHENLEEIASRIRNYSKVLDDAEAGLETLALAARVLHDHLMTGIPTRVEDAQTICESSLHAVLNAALGKHRGYITIQHFGDEAIVTMALDAD